MSKVESFIAEAESRPATREDVLDCYRTYLGREPDEEGFANWCDAVDAGLSLDVARSRFIASTEFNHRPGPDKIAALAGLGQGEPRVFRLNEIESVRAAAFIPEFQDTVRGGRFALPRDYDRALEPTGAEYRQQVLDLWTAITGRSTYDPLTDEDTPEIAGADALDRPGFYGSGDANVAGDHLLALGHLVKLSGVREGDRLLEYGAGFGQIALAFARLGATVDTVDVNPAFCAAVDKLADRYGVKLKSHVGQFGHNPAKKPHSYDLIYFYESFHHCLDFQTVIPKLKKMLKPGGRIMMAGEPVPLAPAPLLPYPWGLRLDGECVAIMRQRGWMELGFWDEFLLATFERFGFRCERHEIRDMHYATVYVFRPDEA